MNYSRAIKKNSMGLRVLASWAVVAVAFSLIGFGVGYASKPEGGDPATGAQDAQDTREEQDEEQESPEIVIYGQYEGKIFQGGLPQEWAGKDLEFVPLDVPMDAELQEYVFYLSEAYDIDFTFAMAVIKQESNFQPDVISPTDDYGLMQINEVNHEYLSSELGITDFLEPHQNVKAGMFVLRKLFEKYETPEKVLMAYNMGEHGAARLWEQGIFEVNYSKNILQIQEGYAAELGKENEQ